MKKGLSFQAKIFIYYSIVLVFIVSFSLGSFYIYISRILDENTIDKLQQLAANASSRIEGILSEMDRTALMIFSNPAISEAYLEYKTNNVQATYYRSVIYQDSRIMDTLSSIYSSNKSDIRISLYNADGIYASIGIPDASKVIQTRVEDPQYMNWYNSLISNVGKTIFVHDDFWSDTKDTRFVSVIREIIDMRSDRPIGIVEVQQPVSSFNDVLGFERDMYVAAYIVTGSGDIIYSSAKNSSAESLSYYLGEAGIRSEGYLKAQNPLDRKNYLVAYNRLPATGWFLILEESEEALLAPVRLLESLMFAVGMGIILLTLIVIFIVSIGLTKPIKLLHKSIRDVSLDNMCIDFHPTNDSNEFIELGKAFNTMFEGLKNSMEQLVQLRSREAKAHLLALQSQMDPHFIYNMLSIISAMGFDGGINKISDVCHKLSNMLRYTTTFNDEMAVVRNELDHARNYLELMKERFEDQLTYTIDFQENVLEIPIPKLILQPLIENCFQHGFKNMNRPWRIEVLAGCENNKWFISVYDNGHGFNEKTLKEFLTKIEDISHSPSSAMNELKLGGLGLLNTYMRLKIVYQDNLCFDVQSHPDQGTTITIGGALCD